MEKGHPAVRMDYSCLDVELDLTIQFERRDDAENLKIQVFRGKRQGALLFTKQTHWMSRRRKNFPETEYRAPDG